MRAALAAAVATLAAGGLAWTGVELLSLPRHGDGLAYALVGGADQRRFDAALTLFERSAGDETGGAAERARAEAALARQGGTPWLRSRAQTLLGVLAVQDASSQPRHARSSLAAAAAAFRAALALDPQNEEAAADLELLYAQSGGRRRRPASGSGRSRHRQSHRARGSRSTRGSHASTPSGGGY